MWDVNRIQTLLNELPTELFFNYVGCKLYHNQDPLVLHYRCSLTMWDVNLLRYLSHHLRRKVVL